MNVYIIQNRENNNFLGKRNKWYEKMYKAEIFTSLSDARQRRSKVKTDNGVKLQIIEFELSERAIL